MRVFSLALVVWLTTVAAVEHADDAKLKKPQQDAAAEINEALEEATRATQRKETQRSEQKARDKEQPRDGSVIRWHSMSEVRKLQGQGKKLVVVRVEPLDTADIERRVEIVAQEMRARSAEEPIWVKRSVPADDDSLWLRWEDVPPLTQIFLVPSEGSEPATIYKGSDSFSDLLTWMLELLPPRRPRHIETEQEMEEFMLAAPVSLIAYVPQELGEGGAFLEFVIKLANRHPYLPVGFVFPAETLSYTKHKLSPMSLYYRDEDHVFALNEDRLREMDDFTRDNALKKASHQFISRFPDDAAHIFSQGIDKIVFVFDNLGGRRWRTPSYLRDLALEMRQRVVIAYVDSHDERMDGVKAFFGVEMAEAVRGFDARTERQYWPTRAQDGVAFPHEVQTFVRDMAASKLAPYRRNEEIPEDPRMSDIPYIRKLNADTFETTAMNPELDTLVLFFTSWCRHSGKFATRFLKAADESQGKRKVVFAVIDAEKNDVEMKHKLRIFPTVILFRRITNEEVLYTGRRTYEELLEWIDQEVAKPTKMKDDPEEEVGERDAEYGNLLWKKTKRDIEQKYTLKGLRKTRTGEKETKKEEEIEEGLDLASRMAEKVLAKLNVDPKTIAKTLETQKEWEEEIMEMKKTTVVREEEKSTVPEEKKGRVTEKKETASVAMKSMVPEEKKGTVTEEKPTASVSKKTTVPEEKKGTVPEENQPTPTEPVVKQSKVDEKKDDAVGEALAVNSVEKSKNSVVDTPEKSTVDPKEPPTKSEL